MAVARGALRGRAAGCAALLVLGVAGCTSNAEPSPLPSPTSSPSPSPSSTAAAPSLPPEAEGTSPAAAKAFVRYYFDVINYSARTGETELLRSLGTPSCISCEAIASNIEDIYSAGGHIESDGWQLQSVNAVPRRHPTRPAFDLGVMQSPESVVASEGATASDYPGGKKPMTIYVHGAAGTWQVTRLDEVG